MPVEAPSFSTMSVRRARWGIAGVFFVNGATVGSWAPHIPLVKAGLELSPSSLGIALLAMAVGAVVAMPLAGLAIGHWGSARVTRLAGLLFCPSLVLPVMAPSYPLLIVALAVFGALNGAMDVAMNAHGVAVERKYGRPVMSSYHGMWSLGGLTGAGIGALMLAGFPAGVHALTMATVLTLGAIASLSRLLPDTLDKGSAATTLALPQRSTMALGGLAFLALLAEGAILDWGAVYMNVELGTDPARAAIGFAVFSGAMAIGRFAGDALRQRFGAIPMVRVSAALASGGLAIGLLIGTPTSAVIGFACTGFGLANMVPILFGAAGRVPGQTAATGIAAVATMGYAGFLAGPPLLGFVAEATTVAAALGLVALACLTIGLSSAAVRRADDGLVRKGSDGELARQEGAVPVAPPPTPMP